MCLQTSGLLLQVYLCSHGLLKHQESGGLQFRNAQLSDIAAALDRQFNVNIVIQDAGLAAERYYASFINGEGVDEILAALNTGHHYRIINKDGIIYISK